MGGEHHGMKGSGKQHSGVHLLQTCYTEYQPRASGMEHIGEGGKEAGHLWVKIIMKTLVLLPKSQT